MSKDEPVPPLKIARRVTRKHGEKFAEEWFSTAYLGEDVWEAFAETGLVEWPEGGLAEAPQQGRYQDIEDEILKQTFAAVMPAVAEAFVTAARTVLARERRRK